MFSTLRRVVAKSPYDSGDDSVDKAKQKAAAKGCGVVYPKPNELFVDIDSNRDFQAFKEAVEIFKRFEPVTSWTYQPSSSGLPGRYHVTVTLARVVSDFERIAFQAMLASDHKRELLSYGRLKNSEEHATIFFERLPGTPAPVHPTGFNCTQCNARNDFATANQDDGTYVCFNCRVDG